MTTMTHRTRRARQRTTATQARPRRKRTPVASTHRLAARPQTRRRLTTQERVRRRLAWALRLQLGVHYQGSLRVTLNIGPAWIGFLISAAVRLWWPELAPLLPALPAAGGVVVPMLFGGADGQ